MDISYTMQLLCVPDRLEKAGAGHVLWVSVLAIPNFAAKADADVPISFTSQSVPKDAREELERWPATVRGGTPTLAFELEGRRVLGVLHQTDMTSLRAAMALWPKVFHGFGAKLNIICHADPASPKAAERGVTPVLHCGSAQVGADLDQDVRQHILKTLNFASQQAAENRGKGGAYSRLVAATPVTGDEVWERLAITQSRDAPLSERTTRARHRDDDFAAKLLGGGLGIRKSVRGALDRVRNPGGPQDRYVRMHLYRSYPESKKDEAAALAYDFHTRWNGLLSSATMGRVFGVVRDFAIALGPDFDDLLRADTFKIRVESGLPHEPPESYPATCCLRTSIKTTVNAVAGVRLLPKSYSERDTAAGTLPLQGGFKLTSVNSYGHADRCRTVAEAHADRINNQVEDEQPALPVGTSWGLALQRLSAPPQPPPRKLELPPCLYAEDLCIGYRFDLRPTNRDTYVSLCDRAVSHFPLELVEGDKIKRLVAAKGAERYEEGMLQRGGSMVQSSANPDDIAKLEWDEWFVWQDRSLSAADTDPVQVHNPNEPSEGEQEGPEELPYTTAVVEPVRSQYRMRYGGQYQLACREVYLGGLGLGKGELGQLPTATVSTLVGVVVRPEPLTTPRLALEQPIDELHCPGDQMDLMVVRSGPDVRQSGRKTSRYVLAPRVTTDFASLHLNTFDQLKADSKLPEGAYSGMLLTEDGDIPTVDWINLNYPDAHFPFKSPPGSNEPNDAIRVRENAMLVPSGGDMRDRLHEYYPDPMVRSIHFALSARESSCWGDGIGTLELYRDRNWPDAGYLRVEAHASEQSAPKCLAQWSPKSSYRFNTLSVALMPGEDVTLKVWSGCLSRIVRKSTLATAPRAYATIKELADEKDASFEHLDEEFEKLSLSFANPATHVRLLHATQQPWVAPAFITKGNADLLSACERDEIGSTQALFKGGVTLHAPTTISLRSHASWQDTLDVRDGMPVAPYTAPNSGLGFEVLNIPADDADTRMLYSPKDRSRPVLKMEFNDTRHHRVRLEISGSSRFADWFPKWAPEKFESKQEVPLTVDVSSSKRPPPPRPLYLVPLFETRQQQKGNQFIAESIMVGYRLWLDPPVFESGNHPHLAVVCLPKDPTPALPESTAHADGQLTPLVNGIPREIEPYISRIGNDPMWPGSKAYEWLSMNFFDAPVRRAGLRFPGQASDASAAAVESQQQVAIAAFPIAAKDYLADHGQYAIDVMLARQPLADNPRDAPYLPFVRLALAIYQPYSLQGVELSPIVVADMVQINPSRQLTCTPDAFTKGRYRLVLAGFGHPEFLANTPDAPDKPVRLLVSVIIEALTDKLKPASAKVLKHMLKIERRGRDYVAVFQFDLKYFETSPEKIRVIMREHWNVQKDELSRVQIPGPGDVDTHAHLPRSAIAMIFDV